MGCDVSKGYADFVIIDSDMNCIEENFQLDDTASGHQELQNRINLFFEKNPTASLCSAVESTGGYENNWYGFLLQQQNKFRLKVARLNPNGIAHDNKAAMTRNLTDKISARSIAEYLIRHPEKVRYGQKDHHASLKKIWGHLRMLKKQYGELYNELESLLYSANPEMLSYCKNKLPQWVMTLLTKYPTAMKLSRARIKSVASIPFVSEKRAIELVERAKSTVAATSDEITGFLITSTVKQLIQLNKTIELYEKQLEASCDWPEVDLLTTINGIGKITAIVLMLYIQDIHRFSSSKKLASFLGVHPEYKISGDGAKKGSFRMSKKGQKAPRTQLFMSVLAALSESSRNPVIRRIYDTKRKEGMRHKSAVGVCIHKYIRIVYGVLKTQTAFDPTIDERNRKRNLEVTSSGIEQSRRFQAFDMKAPISKRQLKKRKEQTKSQDSESAKYGIKGRSKANKLTKGLVNV